MNITFVISQLGGGGAERVMSILCNGFAAKNHQVRLVTYLPYKDTYMVSDKVQHDRYECDSKDFYKHIRCIRKSIKDNKSDVVVSFLPLVNVTSIIANFGLRSKVIVSERNDPNSHPQNKKIRFLRDFMYFFSDGFVFQTEDARKYFGKKAKSAALIANPLSDKLPEVRNEQRSKYFVTAVRLEPQKNLEMMIDAFSMFSKQHDDYELRIFGQGSCEYSLKEKINDMGFSNKIKLMGFTKNIYEEEIGASGFLLSSDYEGISNSMIEALALGIPVISTDHPIGGAKMFIKPGINGLLVKCRDTEGFCEALETIVNDEWHNRDLSQEAIRIRNELSMESIIQKWEKYIENTIQ